MNRKSERGFTLIELIVVTTIMVVLTMVALVSYAAANQKARDGRRMADLQKISLALEMIRQVGQTYPADLTPLTPNYLQVMPTDPKGYGYFYNRIDAYHYNLDAHLENLGSTNPVVGGNNCGGLCNFRVTNP